MPKKISYFEDREIEFLKKQKDGLFAFQHPLLGKIYLYEDELNRLDIITLAKYVLNGSVKITADTKHTQIIGNIGSVARSQEISARLEESTSNGYNSWLMIYYDPDNFLTVKPSHKSSQGYLFDFNLKFDTVDELAEILKDIHDHTQEMSRVEDLVEKIGAKG